MQIREPKKRENLFLKLETKHHGKLGKCESKNFVLRVLEYERDEFEESKHPCIQIKRNEVQLGQQPHNGYML